MTQNNTAAAGWGGNIDVTKLPNWSYTSVAENVMYTRSFLAMNPGIMQSDGSMDLSQPGITFPQDIAGALNNANTDPSAASSAPSSTPSAAPSTASTLASDPAAAATTNTPNGATTTSPKFVVAFVAAAASYFLL
jgi:hypothetical protein